MAVRVDDLAGKAVLVTGSSTRIGAAVACGFGARGMRVAVHGNANVGAAEQVAADIRTAEGHMRHSGRLMFWSTALVA